VSDIVAEAMALLEAASPAPWNKPASGHSYVTAPNGKMAPTDWPGFYDGEHLVCESTFHRGDQDLIAAAPTLIAALCAEIERLRAEQNDFTKPTIGKR
jgi:hypothetical protein